MQRALLLVTLMALVGCRAPGARIDPFAPAGAQRVPAPGTGTLGTPTPQPANPYYPSGLSQAPAATNAWQPAGNAGPGIAGLGTPTIAGSGNANLNANSQFGTAQPTSPAVIRNQALPVNTGTLNQPATNPNSTSGQFFNTSAPSTNLAPNTGAPGNGSFAPAAPAPPASPSNGSIFNQPQSSWPANNGTVPPNNWNGGVGMPINDATSAYPQPPQNNLPTPSWSVGGLRNWIQSQPWLTTQANPTFQPAPAITSANGAAMQPMQAVAPLATPNAYGAVGTGVATPTPTAGYSTVPAATSLPVRGMPNAVQPAGWTTPTATPTPASPTAANLHQPATVRGNLETETQTGAVVGMRQTSPTPHAADMYGHHEQYMWLRGKLEFSSIDKRWKLRYIPHDAAEGRMDSYGGSVVLVDNGQLKNFSSGDFVMAQGRVGEKSTDSSYAPLYHVQQVSPLE